MLKDVIFQVKLLFDDFLQFFSKKDKSIVDKTKLDIEKFRSEFLKKSSTQTSIPILPTSSIQTVNEFFGSHRGLMHKLFLKKLSKAIEENQTVVELFRLENTPIVAKLVEKDYDVLIEDALNYFIEKEDYEMARQCQELRDKYQINKLLKSTRK